MSTSSTFPLLNCAPKVGQKNQQRERQFSEGKELFTEELKLVVCAIRSKRRQQKGSKHYFL